MENYIEQQEKKRLFSLHKGVVKARWIYLAIFIIYGVSIATLTRTLGYEGYSTASDIRQILTRSWAILWVCGNLAVWMVLRLKKDTITLKGLKILSYFQVGMDMFFVTGEFMIVGGLEGTTGSLYFFPLVISALLFPPIGVIITSIFIITILSAVTLLDHFGIIQHFSLYASEVFINIATPLIEYQKIHPELPLPETSLIYANSLILFFTYLGTIAIIIAVAVVFWLTAKMLHSTELALRRRGEELKVAKNKIEAVVANLIDGLILLDKDKRIALINPEARVTLGIKKQEIIGKKIDEIFGLPNLTQLYKVLGKKIEWTGQKYELSLGAPLIRHFQVITSPVVTPSEQRIGLMIILHDVTREKEIERLKTEFVSIAAHQLRTPLSAIKWTLRMTLDGDAGKLTKDQTDLLQGGYQSNERMIDLVNDLLNVARIEEGRFIYEMSSVALEELIQQVIDSIDPLVKKKDIKLSFIKPQEPLPEIEADKEKIELVVQNLIENAIKYTDKGGIVTIAVKSDTINIEMMVKDNGLGIPQSQQERIFSKFFRADNVMRKGSEGTGMGLFIAKSIIEKHGGRIWFESTENKGATFWFSLPIKKIKQK